MDESRESNFNATNLWGTNGIGGHSSDLLDRLGSPSKLCHNLFVRQGGEVGVAPCMDRTCGQ